MNIIHYLIGIPPYRHGGALVYAIDLLLGEKGKDNNNIYILTPGDTFSFTKTTVKQTLRYKGVLCYEITNPVLPPLMHGVCDPEMIINEKKFLDDAELNVFYNQTKPDIIHIHTFMGLPYRFLGFMKRKGVKLVATSHDYYGICPRVNLIDRFGKKCEDACGILCKDCNITAKGKFMLKVLNSKLFLKYKKILPSTVTKLRNQKSRVVQNGNLSNIDDFSYVNLHNYYVKMYDNLDAVHFNSIVPKYVFSQYLKLPYNEIIPITTNSIHDRRSIKIFHRHIRLSFIAGLGTAKGFPLLKSVLMDILSEGIDNWTLNVWYGGQIGLDSDCKHIVYKGEYTQEQLSDVYSETDILVVPSIWKETFSLVTLEALSFGVPVLMSDNVGAQILIQDIASDFIYHDKEGLKNKLRGIFSDPSQLTVYNKKVCESTNINFSEEKHVNEMLAFYKRVMSL